MLAFGGTDLSSYDHGSIHYTALHCTSILGTDYIPFLLNASETIMH